MSLKVTVLVVVFSSIWAADVIADPPADEAAIRQAVESYVAAFNAGDAKQLAQLWSPEAVYTNPLSGEQAVGREAIEQQFTDIFAESKEARLTAKTHSVSFVSPNVAVEQGTASVVRPGQEPEQTTYSAVYVKRDGHWLLDRVTEEEVPVVVSNYEHLKDLEWMVGTWLDQDEQVSISTHCHWTKNKNFLVRSFSVVVRDRVDMAGMQIVGWDPVAKRIRSWVFDSDGGFGEGMWTKRGDSWYVHVVGTTAEGTKSSATNVITYVDDDTFTWQSLNREAGGELLPNVGEAVVVRQPME